MSTLGVVAVSTSSVLELETGVCSDTLDLILDVEVSGIELDIEEVKEVAVVVALFSLLGDEGISFDEAWGNAVADDASTCELAAK